LRFLVRQAEKEDLYWHFNQEEDGPRKCMKFRSRDFAPIGCGSIWFHD
jgi:hypothetical protein